MTKSLHDKKRYDKDEHNAWLFLKHVDSLPKDLDLIGLSLL